MATALEYLISEFAVKVDVKRPCFFCQEDCSIQEETPTTHDNGLVIIIALPLEDDPTANSYGFILSSNSGLEPPFLWPRPLFKGIAGRYGIPEGQLKGKHLHLLDKVMDVHNTVYICHRDCLKLAQRMLGQLSARQLERIARQTCHIMAVSSFLDPVGPAPTLPIIMDTQSPTNLEALFVKMRKELSYEIIQMILRHTSDFVHNLNRCLTTVHWVRSNLSDEPEQVLQPFRVGGMEFSVGIRSVDVLGEQCLSSINTKPFNGTDSPYDEMTIRVSQKVTGVQIALGTLGVVDFRFIFADGSRSMWLDPRLEQRRWTTTYHNVDIGCLQGFKIIDMFPSEPTPTLYYDTDNIMPAETSTSAIYEPKWQRLVDGGLTGLLRDIQPKYNIQAVFQHRLSQYLSLQEARSITVFSSWDGVTHIRVNDSTEGIGGPPKGCTITHFLHPGEWVQAVHYISLKEFRDPKGVHLLLRTSKGRGLHFGPSRQMGRLDFSNLQHPKKKNVRGLFIDATAQKSSDEYIKALGAVFDNSPTGSELVNPLSQVSPDTQSMPQPWSSRHSNASKFTSVANFANVRSLHLQKRGFRCVGLLITRQDGCVDVLGQWDPTYTEQTSLLYDGAEGPLDAVTFIRYPAVVTPATSTRTIFVPDVWVGDHGERDDAWVVVKTDGSEVEWRFDETTTLVRPWTGILSHWRVPTTSRFQPTLGPG